MKKNNIIKLLVIVAVLVIAKLIFNPYARISRYVERNQGNLRQSCEFYIENGVIDDSYSGIKIDGIFGDANKIVQFYFSGKGLVPSSTYYGFYYSPTDVPVPYVNAEFELTKEGDNKWNWDGEGDNGGIIRKICDNWYYYEAWF